MQMPQVLDTRSVKPLEHLTHKDIVAFQSFVKERTMYDSPAVRNAQIVSKVKATFTRRLHAHKIAIRWRIKIELILCRMSGAG